MPLYGTYHSMAVDPWSNSPFFLFFLPIFLIKIPLRVTSYLTLTSFSDEQIRQSITGFFFSLSLSLLIPYLFIISSDVRRVFYSSLFMLFLMWLFLFFMCPMFSSCLFSKFQNSSFQNQFFCYL